MINPIVRWSFYLFVFSIPIEYPTGLPTQIHTVTAVAFLVGAVVMEPRLCFRRPPGAVWWLAAYLWVLTAVSIVTEYRVDSITLLVHSAIAALLLWVGSNVLRDQQLAYPAIGAFVLGCAALAAIEVAGYGLSLEAGRRSLFGQDANFMGGNMALALVALVALLPAMRTNRSFVVGAAAVGALLAVALVTTGSRGAFVAGIAGLLAFIAAGPTARNSMARAALAAAIVGSLLWAGSMFEPTRTRVARTLATGNMAGRERIYPEAWQMIVEKPVLGWGPIDARYELRLRTYAAEPDRIGATRDAHNLVLESLMAVGLLGTLPFLTAIALCVAAAWRARAGPDGGTAFALIATVLALSMSANWSTSKEAWLFFGYGLASRRHA